MAVYNIYGDAINSAYDVNGIGLQNAYSVNSDVIPLDGGKGVDYDAYTIEKRFEKGITPTQGFDIYDGKVFWASANGNDDSPSNCYVLNLSDGSQAFDEAYIKIYKGHCNNLSFDYPKLYTSSAYTPHGYINTFDTGWNATLTKTLCFADGSTDTDCCVDETDKNILWTIGHVGALSAATPHKISKWDISDLTDNGDGTYTPELLQSVDTVKPTCPYYQGCKFHDGIFWYASGYPQYHAYVYGIDPNTGAVLHTIDMNTNAEPEGIAFYPDRFAFGGFALYVGFGTMKLYKVTFASKPEVT